MQRLALLLSLILFASACRKAVDRDLEKETDAQTGKWTTSSIRFRVTDTLGKTVADSTVNSAGSIEFRQATGEDADVFNPVLFEGRSAATELVGYFRGFSAGDPTTAGGWALYWDADPAGERVIIWGIGPSSSYHRIVNLEYEGKRKRERTMWYTYTAQGTPALRYFVYFNLKK